MIINGRYYFWAELDTCRKYLPKSWKLDVGLLLWGFKIIINYHHFFGGGIIHMKKLFKGKNIVGLKNTHNSEYGLNKL